MVSNRGLGVLLSVIGLACPVLAACGNDDPADVAGTYAVNVTNGDNGCGLPLYNVGGSASNLPFVITQTDHTVTGTVGGRLLDARLGSSTFEGQVDEQQVHMEIIGVVPQRQGNCTYTYNATLRAEADGDFLEGTISYTVADNGNSDCASLASCATVQRFNGSRAPQ